MSTLSVVIDASTRGTGAFAQMATSLAGVKAAADATNTSLDDTKVKTESTSSSMGLLSKANIDLATRFKDTRTQVDNVRQALVAHGVASRDAETATKGLFDQLARKGVLSDLKTAFSDAGVSVRGMGSQLSVMATELVNAQQQAENSTPILSGLQSALGSVGDTATSLGGAVMPVLIGSMVSVGLAATPLIVAFTAWATITTGLAVGLAGLGVATSVFLGGIGLLLGGMTALAVQTGNVNGPLKTFETTWKNVADTLGASATPAVTAMLADLDQLAPTVQTLALAWITWYDSISSPALLIFMGLAQTFLGTIQQLTPQVQGLANAFLQMWPRVQPIVTAFAQLGGQTIVSLLVNLLRLSQWFLQTWPQAASVSGAGFSLLGSAVRGVLTIGAQLVAFFVANWPTISSLARDSASAFQIVFQVVGWLWGIMSSQLGPEIQFLSQHGQDLTYVLVGMASPIIVLGGLIVVLIAIVVDFISFIVQVIVWCGQLKNWLGAELPVAISTLGSYFSQLGANAHSVWSQLTNEIQTDVAAIGGFFSNLGSAAYGVETAFGNAFSSIGSGVHSAFVQVAQIIGNFDSMVDNLPIIGGMLNLPKTIPGFAQGGIVNRPTFGVFGEAGPEALIPLGGGPGNANALNLWAQAGQALGVHGLGAGPNMTPGTWGGQCVVFVEAVEGRHFDVAFAAQMASYVNAATPAPGEIFVSTIPPYGHTGIVLSGNQVIDSNWGLDEMIRIHALSDVPDIVGYIAGGSLSGLPAGSTLDVSSAMTGLVSRALGGAGGLVGSIANGMLNLIISGAKSKFGAGGLGAGLGGGRSSAPSMPSAPRGGGRGAGMGNDRVEALLASIDRKLATIAGAPSVGGLAAAQRIG